MVWWSICSARNGKLWNDKSEKSDITTTFALSWWLDYQRASFAPSKSLVSQPTTIWQKPLVGVLKVNMDGAWNDASKTSAVEVVICDKMGAFVATCSKVFDFISFSIHIETLATCDGLLLVSHRGLQNFIIECDSLQIVTALNKSVSDLSHIDILWKTLKQCCSGSLELLLLIRVAKLIRLPIVLCASALPLHAPISGLKNPCILSWILSYWL